MTDEDKVAYANVRTGRHDVQKRTRNATSKLSGYTGLDQEAQVEKLEGALRQLDSAREQLVGLIDYAKTRDFAAHQAMKERNKAAFASTPTVDLDDDFEDVDD